MKRFISLLTLLGFATAAPVVTPKENARRLEVLFFGAPTKAHAAHDPISRYARIKRELGIEGINFTYSENPAVVFSPATLKQFDAVMMYGNWFQNEPMPADQLKNLIAYVESGHGFLPIHCASACYGGSPDFVKLVGAKFKSHGTGVFEPKCCDNDHPITKGLKSVKAWDETYVHVDHNEDRTLLQKREDEPWTWVRNVGKGRVFYTASGHDERVWNTPEFMDLMKRAVYWSVGADAYTKLKNLGLPKIEMETVQLPGYLEKKAITKAQKPLTPEESIKLAQVPPGFELKLFAAEPNIINPICLHWDNQGRAYIVQTVDYPNDLHAGKAGNDWITICEDKDGDGVADKFTKFADKLSIPTSIVCLNGGALVTNCSEILWLKDTNGDGMADERKSIISGFGTGDTHAGVSNLRLGPDGWVYATVGYAGFNGDVGGQHHQFSQAVFRFLPDGSKLEPLQSTTNNTWGLGFTNDFDVVGSTANANPSWQLSLQKNLYEKVGLSQPKTPRADNNPIFYPSSSDIRQVDQFERYTAGAGHAVYTATRFPSEYQNQIAFVTEATGKLVGQFLLTNENSTFKATELPNNLYNSADAWSGPVCAEVGPDGAVWICDWYNLIIQHNPTPNRGNSGVDAKNGKGNAYESPVRDKKMGRIYRVYPIGSKNDATPTSMAAAEKSPNQFWQLAAMWTEKKFTRSPIGVASSLPASTTNEKRKILAELSNFINTPTPDAGKRIYEIYKDNKNIKEDKVLLDTWRIAARMNADAVLAAAPKENSATAKVEEPVNVLPNGDFNQDGNPLPQGWTGTVYKGAQDVEFSVDPTGGRNGTACIKIVSKNPADAGAAFSVPVKVGVKYKIGGWIKTEKVDKKGGEGSMFNVAAAEHVKTQTVTGTKDWTEVSNTFTADADHVTINCLTGSYGFATGTTWFDDVYVIALGADTSGSEISDLEKWKAAGGAKTATVVTARKYKPDLAVHKRGSEVYAAVCTACHQPDGKGLEAAFPPLNGSDWLTQDGTREIKIVLRGLQGPVKVSGHELNSIMPAVVGYSDAQLADVLTYVRQSWDNDLPPVTEGQVKAVKATIGNHPAPWTAGELGK